MRLLVTGGAGYIGSVVAASLIEAGHDVTVLDDLSTGHADAVPAKASFVRGTLRDDAARVLSEGIDAVLHFAAKSLVGESVAFPGMYWSHNLGGSLALLEAMRETGVAPDRLLLHRGGLRRAGTYADRGDRPNPAHQSLRRFQARRGHQPHRVRADVRPRRRSACGISTWRARTRTPAASGTGSSTHRRPI